jgi:hypothetical protein
MMRDGTLGFPLATNYEEDITGVPTNMVTAIPEQATAAPQATKHGDLLFTNASIGNSRFTAPACK